MRIVLISFALILSLGLIVLVSPLGKREAEPAEVELSAFGSVEDFSLTAQDGEPFASERLRGKVWLANFVFTSCAAECPILTQRMTEVRDNLGNRQDVAFVSFSVDPQTDTPERLRQYAEPYGLDERWALLTGEEQTLDALIKRSFLLPVARDYHERLDVAQTGFIHSNKLVVVDEEGVVRYYRDGLEPGAVADLTEAMVRLLKRRG